MKPLNVIQKKETDWVILEIDTETKYQEILGFGGAFTEAAAYMFS
jgi:O-glycosyl hydrolase